MNYQKHYNRLIERARNRKLEGYKERHHIVPRCLGGDDSKENLVDLTPEEHYVAHQLLVRIHPNNGRLVHAALMMVAVGNTSRKNKLYGWLRRKVSNEAKKRIGEKNGSYGKRWVNDGVKSFKIRKDEPLQEGWVVGRMSTQKERFCRCGNRIYTKFPSLCKTCRENYSPPNSKWPDSETVRQKWIEHSPISKYKFLKLIGLHTSKAAYTKLNSILPD